MKQYDVHVEHTSILSKFHKIKMKTVKKDNYKNDVCLMLCPW